VRFVVDENLSPRLAEWLTANGHDAVHVRTIAGRPLRDRDILCYALRERCIVVTSDFDVGELAARDPTNSAQVLLLRLASTRLPRLIARFGAMIGALPFMEGEGAVIVVTEPGCGSASCRSAASDGTPPK
jgi:predicted nuclease of predicted toxin-antitoxin system